MDGQIKGYRVPARIIHWTFAILILSMIPVGFLMLQDWIARDMRNTMFILHKNVGSFLLIFIVVRLIYRWMNPPQLAPVKLPAIQELAAKLTHFGLYALLVIMPLAGYIRVRAGGFPIELLDRWGVPALVPRSDALADVAKQVHFYGAYAITALIAMHIGAACYHGLIRRDGIFTRMWPPFRNS